LTFKEELLKEENVGSAFLKIAPYLKLYATYAHDYELAITSLQVFIILLRLNMDPAIINSCFGFRI
jgi:hypothetical protein